MAKLYTRACEACQPGKAEALDGSAERIAKLIGQTAGNGYHFAATDGKAAIIKAGPATTEGKGWTLAPVGPVWGDLSMDFHAALRRVRLAASARQPAIRLDVGPWRVRLSAQNYDGDQAGETVEFADSYGEVPEYTVHLSPEYLDSLCGVWPLRWYCNGDGKAPQVFQAAGADWRAVVMPM